jgi:uncharacterized coiled-coil protein SlyX
MAAIAMAPLNTAIAQTHARLGDPDVRSTIGSPLHVRIPVEPGTPGEEVPASRFAIGLRPLNASIPFIDTGELGLEKIGERYFIVIRSRSAIGEPIVGLVIRERLPGGIRSREFTLLVDPPAASQPVSATDATPARPVESIPPPPPSPTVSAPQTLAEARALEQRHARRSTRPARPPRAEIPAIPRPRAAPAPRVSTELGSAAPRTPRKTQAAIDVQARGSAAKLSGPTLKLSMSTDALGLSPTASEEKRAELKLRRELLDLDDLTAALLERQNRIGQLEKELAALTERMARAEQRIGSAANTEPASASPPAPVPPSATDAAVPAKAALDTPTATPAAKPADPRERSGTSFWLWLAGLLLFGACLYAVLRAQARRRDREQRLSVDEADAFVRANTAQRTQRASAVAPVAVAPSAAASEPPAAQHTGSSPVSTHARAEPAPHATTPERIEFELPPLDADELASNAGNLPPEVGAAQTSIKTAGNVATPGAATTRRAKFLKSRYHDIAILNPPLDNTERLLWQAGTLYGEGAIEFACRLLKFAAYSRQLTEPYWLALFELLYREKNVNEYTVNARWFFKHHPRSAHWPEVQRIGFLLDPSEPLFAQARAWSHEEPARGHWLPNGEQKAGSTPLPSLKLELAS